MPNGSTPTCPTYNDSSRDEPPCPHQLAIHTATPITTLDNYAYAAFPDKRALLGDVSAIANAVDTPHVNEKDSIVLVTLEPTIALNTCENALRTLISTVLSEALGPEWLAAITDSDRIAEWEKRATSEHAARTKRGVAIPPPGLAYAQFFDLVRILKSDKLWTHFAPALGKRAETISLIDRFDSLRNTVAHGRPLVPYEQELLSGIAGQIRNQVTRYMSSQDPAGDFYPRIETIRDGFGNEITDPPTPHGELAGRCMTDLVLTPGERVVFTVLGTDPQGRDLEWRFEGRPGFDPRSYVVTSRNGEAAQLIWDVTDADVNETATIQIYMESSSSQYHRFGWFDQRAYFRYIVRPPQSSLLL